jgi:hypothetical protein
MKKSSVTLFIAIVVITMATLSCNAGSIGSLFSTQTPTPTDTPIPTNTPSPTSTPINTPTPTIEPTGTSKINQADGSTLFTDYDNQYTIVFPQGWTTISLTQDDLKQILASVSDSNPDLKNTLTMLETMDPETFRIFAFDFRPDHFTSGYANNVNISVQSNSIVNGMTLQNLVDVNVQAIPQMLPNATVNSSKVTQTASDIPVGVIDISMPVNTSNGTTLTAYEQLSIIKLPEGIAVITFAYSKSMQTILLPEFSGMLDSFEILGQ